jgi:hypothetical protein
MVYGCTISRVRGEEDMKRFRSWNNKELNEQVLAISDGYLRLCKENPKVSTLLESFEQRRRSAEANGYNIEKFLQEEITFLEALQSQITALSKGKEVADQERLGYKERVRDELQKMHDAIQKYPLSPFVVEGYHELSRLYGAITEYEKEYWADVVRFLQTKFPIRAKSPQDQLENELFQFISICDDRPPQALNTFVDLMRRNQTEKLDDIAFAATKEAAFFLNHLKEKLKECECNTDKPIYVALMQIITDFRIKDIKRK